QPGTSPWEQWFVGQWLNTFTLEKQHLLERYPKHIANSHLRCLMSATPHRNLDISLEKASYVSREEIHSVVDSHGAPDSAELLQHEQG
uniref:Uncharacterized protein n=1 Tax=Ficedula albicollis TaxID=59894 RepID=A0A803V971_FICAL